MRLFGTVLLLCASTVTAVEAQDGATVFEKLHGEWIGEGTLMRRAATYTMKWRNGDDFAVLEFSNSFSGADGISTPVLNAVAVYRTGNDTQEAVWLDSRPERIAITWESTDHTLTANWSSPTERGRTTYRIMSLTEIEVVDEVWIGAELRPFGRARYTPASGIQ